MKRFIFFARICSWLVFAFPLALAAQHEQTYPNYVVIGAFAYQKNAINFTADATKNKFPARFEMNPNRNLYYVYVLTTDDRELAIAEAVRLRAETKYFDTWVYSGALGTLVLSGQPDRDFDPVTGEKMESVTTDQPQNSSRQSGAVSLSKDTGEQQPKDGGVTNASPSRPPAVSTETEKEVPAADREREASAGTTKGSGDAGGSGRKGNGKEAQASAENVGITAGRNTGSGVTPSGPASDTDQQGLTRLPPDAHLQAEDTSAQAPPPKRVSDEPLDTEDVVGKNFYFHLFRAENGKRVEGDVDAIDFERSRKMATYPANQPVTVRMPSGALKQVSFLCQVFGYRKQQKEFDPNNPAEDLYLDDKGNLVVPFELVRLQKGDIAIMYNVFFFKDAAVMRPESRYEVNNLLELLKENPSYKIKIHGHTNGNASGKIIRMDKPGNFYSLSGTKQGMGSAKKLSEERAMVIREFLISSGISVDRMEVKAWGGKKPIHDKHSVRANENVRVEIEILSE